jgi:antagonist of KipI
MLPIGAGDAESIYPRLARRLGESDLPLAAIGDGLVEAVPAADAPTLRVIAGQQWHAFSDEAQAQFLGAEFRLSPQSDRMGFRLEGPKLALREPLEMISEAVAFGTIQVPPDGNPIVLMADRQTTGGYPKIADVASVDLRLLAQLMPGQRMRFAPISLDAAQRMVLAREAQLDGLRRSVARLRQETA